MKPLIRPALDAQGAELPAPRGFRIIRFAAHVHTPVRAVFVRKGYDVVPCTADAHTARFPCAKCAEHPGMVVAPTKLVQSGAA